jgi:acetyl esterase
MPLDPAVRAYLDRAADPVAQRPLAATSPEDVRARINRQLIADAGPAEPVWRVDDRRVPGPGGPIPVRIYTPEGRPPWPVLVYFHGGGWVVGDLETHDGIARALANGAGCLVVLVDYRRAPEHKFPAAAEDAYAVVKWVAERGLNGRSDPGRIAVGGDSAGGNLAAVAALMARDRGGPRLAFQLLLYPALERRFETASYHENASGFGLTRDDMVWFWRQYLRDDVDAAHAYAAPLRAADLSGLPPALVLTAEYDPLRDEGRAYAERLEADGVPATEVRFAGMIHGFAGMGAVVDDAGIARQRAAEALRAAFAEPGPHTHRVATRGQHDA